MKLSFRNTRRKEVEQDQAHPPDGLQAAADLHHLARRPPGLAILQQVVAVPPVQATTAWSLVHAPERRRGPCRKARCLQKRSSVILQACAATWDPPCDGRDF